MSLFISKVCKCLYIFGLILVWNTAFSSISPTNCTSNCSSLITETGEYSNVSYPNCTKTCFTGIKGTLTACTSQCYLTTTSLLNYLAGTLTSCTTNCGAGYTPYCTSGCAAQSNEYNNSQGPAPQCATYCSAGTGSTQTYAPPSIMINPGQYLVPVLGGLPLCTSHCVATGSCPQCTSDCFCNEPSS